MLPSPCLVCRREIYRNTSSSTAYRYYRDHASLLSQYVYVSRDLHFCYHNQYKKSVSIAWLTMKSCRRRSSVSAQFDRGTTSVIDLVMRSPRNTSVFCSSISYPASATAVFAFDPFYIHIYIYFFLWPSTKPSRTEAVLTHEEFGRLS